MPKRILIVGNSSYLGKFVQEQLESHFTVLGTSRTSDSSNYNIDFNSSDTFGEIINQEFDIALMMASEVSGLDTTNINHSSFDTNVNGYAKFLDHLINNNVIKQVVYISSMTVYSPAKGCINEKCDTTYPPHIYGLSKKLAEEITIYKCNSSNVPYLCLRIPGIYGGNRNNGLIFSSIQKLAKNEKISLDLSKLAYWETIYINDLSLILLDLLSLEKVPSCLLNVSYGEPSDITEIITFIKFKFNSSSVIDLITEQNQFYLDNTKLKQLIPFNFSLKNGLINYLSLLKL